MMLTPFDGFDDVAACGDGGRCWLLLWLKESWERKGRSRAGGLKKRKAQASPR